MTLGPLEQAGPAWDWVAALAPDFDLEGALLSSFLDWVSRERGWSVRFEDWELAESAKSIRVYGRIDGLTLEEAVEVALPSSRLEYRVIGGELLISRPAGAD